MFDINKEQILYAKENLKMRKSMISFDTLGRTLAYSPYMPRIEREFFIRQDLNPPKVATRFCIQDDFDEVMFLKEASEIEQSQPHNVLLLDLGAQYVHSGKVGLDSRLESISLLRRHSTLPIIHADIFLDAYQILESALFGADTLLFSAAALESKALKELLQFAWRLSFDVFVAVRDKDELKKAIFGGANMLFIPQEKFGELLSLVPNSQVIATDCFDEYGVDMWILSKNSKLSNN